MEAVAVVHHLLPLMMPVLLLLRPALAGVVVVVERWHRMLPLVLLRRLPDAVPLLAVDVVLSRLLRSPLRG